ncbi:hypothetical protein HHI36_017688 [Cryptolaemus montrouzieri]|uniref:Uncharacterized protein n=1 Tax=Cryptolaemus montrouzieri TaxID=559131 RepID=A0ABD2NN91_9CUCU
MAGKALGVVSTPLKYFTSRRWAVPYLLISSLIVFPAFILRCSVDAHRHSLVLHHEILMQTEQLPFKNIQKAITALLIMKRPKYSSPPDETLPPDRIPSSDLLVGPVCF